MRLFMLAAVVAGTISFGPDARAQAAAQSKLEPDLEATLARVEAQEGLSVIVQFDDQLDSAVLRGEVTRQLRERYPDPKDRRAARKKLKRAMMVDRLKTKAQAPLRLVKGFLKSRGESAEVKWLWATNSVAVTVPARLVGELGSLPGVRSVKLDAVIQAPDTGTAPTVPTAPYLWNLDATGAPILWSYGHTGSGVVVATLDTGVDATHPDLNPRWRGGAGDWLDPYHEHATPYDNHGHGTQVLGLIVAGAATGYQIGMAPDAQWIAAKIFDDSNQATLSGIHAAFQWLLDPDGDPTTDDAPNIVNHSWDLDGTEDQCVQEFAADIALLKEAEIAVIFAGGNYGPDASTSVSPANDPAVLSVGSMNQTYTVDIQSSRGPGACDGGTYPNLTAPGSDVLTTDRLPGFINMVSGTSFAAPHLAGGIALLMGAFPEATVSQIESALRETALDLGAAGPDNDYGYGLMDVAAAYDALQAALGGGSPGILELVNAEYSVDENVQTLTVTVIRSGGTTGEVTVDIAAADDAAAADPATAGVDYQAASSALTFTDGEASRTFDIVIIDDVLSEADEAFRITLSNPGGGATLGVVTDALATILDDDIPPAPADSDGDGIGDAGDLCPGTPLGETVDANGCSASQLDSDGDGFPADQDCNDGDPAIYPGAPEIKSDGVDQDCNGYDLTIEIVQADYVTAEQQVLVAAESALGAGAALRIIIHGASGESLTRNMTWRANRTRWYTTINAFADRFGFVPVSVTVYGPEGSVEQTLIQIQLDSDGDGVGDTEDLCPGTPLGATVDANGCSASLPDSDGDGFPADQDCNDSDPAIYPGAPEIKSDGVDQDCNGYDLTIAIVQADYVTAEQQVRVATESALGAGAALRIIIHGPSGETLTRSMTWRDNRTRWYTTINAFADRFGFVPVSVTVYGPEGSVGQPLIPR